jgi:hypothetical protein
MRPGKARLRLIRVEEGGALDRIGSAPPEFTPSEHLVDVLK